MRRGIPPCCTLIPGLRSSGAVPRADGDSKDPTSPEAGLSLSCSHDPERLQLPVQDSELAQHHMGCPVRTHKVINELPRGTDTFVFDHAHAKNCDSSSPAVFLSSSTGCLLKDILTFGN